MKKLSFTLFIEITNLDFVFLVGKNDEQNNLKIVHTSKIAIQGIENASISDLEKAFNIIKDNIFLVEQKLNYTFKELILILDNFNPSFTNFVGFKKLNGSQVLRENITYILNTLKSCVDESESKKKILHIFSSNYLLDKKKIDNLPIGLFGDFYSHELSFILINTNDYKNLKSIFDKCKLKIKKTLIKSYLLGANISDNNQDSDSFFRIKLNRNTSKIFYFENNSLKSEQNFKFGTDIIIKDISKVISLKTDIVKIILNKMTFRDDMNEDELLEETFFGENNYRKIKKKLIYEIANARIKEISELILFKNINYKFYENTNNNIFLEMDQKLLFSSLEESFKKIFSMNNKYKVNFIDNLKNESLINTANKLVHFGWKKEAIPVTETKRSIISRFFDLLFD